MTDDVYASYLRGYCAQDDAPAAAAEQASPLAGWALELGRADRRIDAVMRSPGQLRVWARCCDSYDAALRGTAPAPEPDGVAALPVELAHHLARRDLEAGWRRSPLDLAALLRGVGQ